MSASHDVDIAVIGAGPAGLAAAIAARALGAGVLLVDEYASPGGQYHRQPALVCPTGDRDAVSPPVREGRVLAATARSAGVEFWHDATVWAAYRGGVLAVDRAGAPAEVRAKCIVIATGAHDRVMPFPGWTLPGVMTAGAAQALAKAHAVSPGQRVVVAGSGPFLLVVAAELARAGAQVELIEAARPAASTFASFLGFPERWKELASLIRALVAHGVAIRLGRAVTRAEGTDSMTAVISQRLDRNGAPVAGTERRHAADAAAVASGFRTQADIARLLGCSTRYDDNAGGHAVIVDPESGRTTIDGVYAAGEITGVAGHDVAAAEGTIAGLCAAGSLGYASPDAERQRARANLRRRRAQRFADLVSRAFAPGAGLTSLATADTVVCRCEGVTRAAIEQAIDAGAGSASAVKRWTRCGMGRCQGRICGWPLARIVAARAGLPVSVVDNFTARLPLKPVALGTIAGSNHRDAPSWPQTR